MGIFYQKTAEVHDHRILSSLRGAFENNLASADLAGDGKELYRRAGSQGAEFTGERPPGVLRPESDANSCRDQIPDGLGGVAFKNDSGRNSSFRKIAVADLAGGAGAGQADIACVACFGKADRIFPVERRVGRDS